MIDLQTPVGTEVSPEAGQTGKEQVRTARSSRAARIALLGLLGLPILVAGLAVLPNFDGLYGQDPYAYFDYATGPLRTALLALRLPPPFVWPPGYPLLVALASLVLGQTPRAGQLVSLVAAALVPVFTALLAFEVWSRQSELGTRNSEFTKSRTEAEWRIPGSEFLVPLLAGLLAGLVGQLWQSSVVVMADTAGLAAATLGMWAAARYGRDEPGGTASAGWLLLAAAGLAFAILTRWAYALVAIPAAVYALLALARRSRRDALWHGAAAALVVVVVLAPVWIAGLRALAGKESGGAPFTVDLQVYSWSPLNAFRRQFVTADGLLSYPWPNGLWYALAPAHRFYFTVLLAPLLLPGLWAVIRRKAAAPILLLIGWAAAIFVFHAGAPWQNFRFNLAHLPPLAILVAIGVQTVAAWLAARLRRPALRRLALLALAAYVLAGMLLMARGGWALTRSFVERKNADLALVREVEALAPPDADLVTFGLTLTFQHYSHLPTHEIFSLDQPALAQLAGSGRPLYLLLDLTNVENQWQGRSPEVNYRSLEQHTSLRQVASLGPYTLFEMQAGPMTSPPVNPGFP